MKKIWMVLLIVGIAIAIPVTLILNDRSTEDQNQLNLSAGDSQFLSALEAYCSYYPNRDRQPELKEGALEEFQKLVENFGGDYPTQELINLLPKDSPEKNWYLMLSHSYWYDQIFRWKIYYPEANLFPETLLAEEIRNTPYEVWGWFGKLTIYCNHTQDWEEAIREYEKLSEKYPESQIINGALLRLSTACPFKSIPESQAKIGELLKERVGYLEVHHTKTILEKWTLLCFYHLLSDQLDNLRERIVALTSPDDYYLWSASDFLPNYPGPSTFAHREITFVIDETTIPPEAISVILSAFQKWEAATEGGIKFKQVYLPPPYKEERNDKYDILVRPRKESDFCYAAGCSTSGGDRMSCSIELAIVYFDPTIFWKDGISSDLYPTAIHEIGHALGLKHSYEKKDIMWEGGDRGKNLSQRDINTIRLMYPKKP